MVRYRSKIDYRPGSLRRLYDVRHSKQMRQIDVAEAAGVAPLTIYRAEAGRLVSSATLASIAKALDVEPGDLM